MMNFRTDKAKILVIEDDPNLAYILQESLELQGFEVVHCEDGEAGHSAFLKQNFDLCLIDVMLPKKDGFILAQEIREIDQHVSIIFLTAKSLKEDRIEGFKIGGDDYITKPFSMEELVLRIQAVLKRMSNSQFCIQTQKEFFIGDYIFDFEGQALTFKGQAQKLTHKESELLRLLCLNINQILDREIALKQIWSDDSFFAARSMDVYITRLRKYLSGDDRIEILNVHGKGFKLKVR